MLVQAQNTNNFLKKIAILNYNWQTDCDPEIKWLELTCWLSHNLDSTESTTVCG